MKIIITGSLGNIGKPLTQELVEKGHSVTVISSQTERAESIKALGAKAAIGTMQDVDFLSTTFAGADIVYLMETVPHSMLFHPTFDIIAHVTEIGNNYKKAILKAGIKRVILLSSVGAHTAKGNGSLLMHYNVENVLEQLPSDVSIKIMRPTGFFTNIFRSLETIKKQGVIISNYGGDKKEPWVSPLDIAATIAAEMELPFEGRTVHYVASEEVSPNQIAAAVGEAIGKPELKWLAIPDEQLLNGMLSAGMNPKIAHGFIEMQAAQGDGTLYEDFDRHKPVMGKVKLKDFAKEFALVFNK